MMGVWLSVAEMSIPLTVSGIVLQVVESYLLFFDNRSFERFPVSAAGW
jgi:hypothetical protein